MNSFPDFWTFLETGNPQWWDFTKMRFGAKDLKKCAMDCYAYILADEKLLKMEPAGLRKYFVSWLMKAPDAAVAPTLQQVEEQPTAPPEPIVTGKERDEWLKKWQEQILKDPVVKRVPRITKRQAEEEGQWVPKANKGETFNRQRQMEAALEHMNTIFEARRKEYMALNPNATEEEVKVYLESIKIESL